MRAILWMAGARISAGLAAFGGEGLAVEGGGGLFGLRLPGDGSGGRLGAFSRGKGEQVNCDQADEADHDGSFQCFLRGIARLVPTDPP